MHEYNLYKVIDRISVRTGMYTGDQSLSNIGSYISGYAQAMDDAGIKEITYPKFENFRAWIKTKFGFDSDVAGWQGMLLALAIGCVPEGSYPWKRMKNATEEEHLKSVKLFFLLLDEYKNVHK